jgi:hypothetical protein
LGAARSVVAAHALDNAVVQVVEIGKGVDEGEGISGQRMSSTRSRDKQLSSRGAGTR